MKCYYYGEPSYTLTKAVFAAKAKSRWLRFPAALAMVLVWALLMPWAWLAIQAGEVGHRVAGWCGFNSRDW